MSMASSITGASGRWPPGPTRLKMIAVVGARIAGLCVVLAIGGCTPADDQLTSVTDSAADIALQDSVEESPAATISPAGVATTALRPRVEVGTKDVRTRAPDLLGNGVSPDGFDTIVAEVTSADGEMCTVCLWLADVADERVRGLMGVTDLGDAVGMAFVFDEPSEGAFVMAGTPTPLSIAWFDVDGGYVSALDMEPCLASVPSQCERYRSAGPYLVAIEMLQGELDAIGIGDGSTLKLLDGTEAADCGTPG